MLCMLFLLDVNGIWTHTEDYGKQTMWLTRHYNGAAQQEQIVNSTLLIMEL